MEINGFTIEKSDGYNVGYSTATKMTGNGRKFSGWKAVDSDGYERNFDTKKQAIEFAEEY